MAVSVTPASSCELKTLEAMLPAIFEESPALAERCQYFCADRGYDSGPLKASLWDDYRIRPLVDTRLLWRSEKKEAGYDPSKPITRPRDPDRADTLVYTEKGELFCICPEIREQRPLAFHGFEADRTCLKYRCPAAAYDIDCAGRAACEAMAGCRTKDYGRVVRVPLHTDHANALGQPDLEAQVQGAYSP